MPLTQMEWHSGSAATQTLSGPSSPWNPGPPQSACSDPLSSPGEPPASDRSEGVVGAAAVAAITGRGFFEHDGMASPVTSIDATAHGTYEPNDIGHHRTPENSEPECG